MERGRERGVHEHDTQKVGGDVERENKAWVMDGARAVCSLYDAPSSLCHMGVGGEELSRLLQLAKQNSRKKRNRNISTQTEDKEEA